MKKADEYRRFLEENPDRVRTDPDGRSMFSDVVRKLRSMPEPEAREDFVSRVMERVAREEEAERATVAAAERWRPLRWAARAAAVLAVGLGVGLPAARRAGTEPVASASSRTAEACALIVAEQGADGGWCVAEGRGGSVQSGEDGALSAIALMALMRSGEDPLNGPHGAAVRSGMENLIGLAEQPQGLGDGATRLGRSSRYLAAMALRTGAGLRNAPSEWKAAALRVAREAPDAVEAARLNRQLAHAASMPEPWKKAGGPVLAAALELLEPRMM